jgi:hypothetical protein
MNVFRVEQALLSSQLPDIEAEVWRQLCNFATKMSAFRGFHFQNGRA